MVPLGISLHHLLEARIVLVAARAIGLHHQRAFAHDGGAARHLHVGGFGEHHGAGNGEKQAAAATGTRKDAPHAHAP